MITFELSKACYFLFRIERLWWDVWTPVTHLYYEVLHSLEEDGLLNLSDAVHLFRAHYVFLPHLAEALHTFTEGWDNHPLRSEGGLTPNQLWVMGHWSHAEPLWRRWRFAGLLKLSLKVQFKCFQPENVDLDLYKKAEI